MTFKRNLQMLGKIRKINIIYRYKVLDHTTIVKMQRGHNFLNRRYYFYELHNKNQVYHPCNNELAEAVSIVIITS